MVGQEVPKSVRVAANKVTGVLMPKVGIAPVMVRVPLSNLLLLVFVENGVQGIVQIGHRIAVITAVFKGAARVLQSQR